MNEARALRPDPLAPWAAIVAGVGPVRVEALLTMPDDGWRYEVVEGVLVRVVGSGDLATIIAGIILTALNVFVRPRRLGRVTGASSFSLVTDRRKPVPFAPELAVEVASPDQDVLEMAAKARRYLRGGTRLVWVVWPDARTVDVWHPGDLRPRHEDMRPSVTKHLDDGDALDGEDVIPGFSQPLTDVFNV